MLFGWFGWKENGLQRRQAGKGTTLARTLSEAKGRGGEEVEEPVDWWSQQLLIDTVGDGV